MPFQIKRLTIDHYDAMIKLWRDAELEHRPKGRDTREHVAKEMQRTDSAFIGIFEADRLVGTGQATFDGRRGWINRIAVHPDYRRRGIAEMAVAECERFLESVGANIVGCMTENDNEASMNLFRKLKYREHDDIYFSKRKNEDV